MLSNTTLVHKLALTLLYFLVQNACTIVIEGSAPFQKKSPPAGINVKILLAEDDTYLSTAITDALTHGGYRVDHVTTATEARGALASTPYDLFLLDLGLPDQDGTELLKQIRGEGLVIPVIILTARDTIEDKVSGLDQGANDYITKPFDFRELESRIRALLRKALWGNAPKATVGRLSFHYESKEAFLDDKLVKLTPGELSALELLLRRAGHVVGKSELIDYLSSWDESASENAIEIIIHRLRRKLQPGGVRIETVRGLGYTLEK